MQSGVLSFFPFDPMGMNSVEMQKKEIANGRLAMVAFVGFCSQAAVRGLGPIDCLKAHLADPGHVNSAFPPAYRLHAYLSCISALLISRTRLSVSMYVCVCMYVVMHVLSCAE